MATNASQARDRESSKLQLTKTLLRKFLGRSRRHNEQIERIETKKKNNVINEETKF